MLVKSVKYRRVHRVFPAMEVIDGAGVKLKRYIGSLYLNYLDPFLLLDEFKSDDPNDYIAGFPPHPHRGFQTLTYMISGDFEHRDSTGSSGILSSGGLQWMNAGSGVIHSEMPIMKEGFLWGYQLWLNLPSSEKMSDPFYHNFKAIEISKGEVRVNLLSGGFDNVEQKSWAYYPVVYLDVRVPKGNEFVYEIDEKMNAFCVVSEGEIKFDDGTKVKGGKLAVLIDGNFVKFYALENSVVLVGCGKPLNEPVARWGPFVMNTMEEIYQAIEDYKAGRLVKKKAVDI